MLPKLQKKNQINKIIQEQQCKYINIEENITIDARLIVAGPLYHNSDISEILFIIMEPS